MKNFILNFSGGKSSFAAADFIKTRNSEDNILLYFTDTGWEHPDLFRFLFEASDKLHLPLLLHSRGITPAQLMVQKRFMANNRVGICSKELKMKVAADYLTKGIVPEVEKWYNKQYLKDEDFITDATLIYGISFMEAHREGPIRANWEKYYKVEFPLIDNIIDNDTILKKYNIRQPRLYDMKFSHNNCSGKCVKSGGASYKNLLMKDPTSFFNLMEQEIVISEYIRYTKQPAIKKGISKDYLFKDVYEFVSTGKKSDKIKNILRNSQYLSSKRRCFGVDSKGNDIKKPYTFMKNKSLLELKKDPIQIDIFDFGGCGCYVDYADFNEESVEVMV